MNWDSLAGDIVAMVACLFALYYTFRMWRLVKAPSRAVLLLGMGYMLFSRVWVLISQWESSEAWVAQHRSIVVVPVYVLLAIAFGMTYHELKGFHFNAPKDAEHKGGDAAQDKEMEEMSVPMKRKENP